jgi:hypothetical protein
MPISLITGNLSLEWIMLPNGRPALAFDKPTWKVYEDAAATRRQTAQQMITASVAAAIGPILADHYSRPPKEGHMTAELRQPTDKAAIRAKLVELILRAAGQGIDIEALIHEALEIADVEPS